MAAKIDAPETEHRNKYDPNRTAKIVKKYEDAAEDFLAHRMAYVASCKPFRERMAAVFEEGVAFGIPKKVLKTKLKERDLQRKLDGIAEDLEDDDQELFDQLSEALGELKEAIGQLDGTPLGRAAEAAVEKASPIGASNWTLAMEDRLRSLVAGGWSASKIAEAMNLTVKQVSGKANRMGLSLKGNVKPEGAVERDVGERDVGAENGERLAAGIKGLPGAEAPGKHSVQ